MADLKESAGPKGLRGHGFPPHVTTNLWRAIVPPSVSMQNAFDPYSLTERPVRTTLYAEMVVTIAPTTAWRVFGFQELLMR